MSVDQETHRYRFDWNGRTNNIKGTEFPRELNDRYAFLVCDYQILEDSESRFVIGFKEPVGDVALVVAFDRPEGAGLTWDASTESGTLEAWLHRRKRFEGSRSFQHVEEFWAKSPPRRAEDDHAIELVGSARIRFAYGRLYRVDVDLESVDPVPLYTEFLDDHPTYENDEDYWRRRAREARMKATINGRFLGYWYNLKWRLPGT